MGFDGTGKYFVQVYWLMGRRENSRNRVLEKDDNGKVWTVAADPKKVKDPSLIIYTAMDEKGGLYVVSNGSQTDTIITEDVFNRKCGVFRELMFEFEYEADPPIYTPRISAIYSLRGVRPSAEMAILKKSDRGFDCDRYFYSFSEFEVGVGHCITTYKGPDENPLQAFDSPPYSVELKGEKNIFDTAEYFWENLDEENRISLAVKAIDLKTGISIITIKNKYAEVN